MQAVVSKTVEQLSSSSKNSALREACAEVNALLETQLEGEEERFGFFDKHADVLLKPYKIASELRDAKLAGIVIDGLEKLFSFGFLCGDVVYGPDPSKRLIDVVIEMLCEGKKEDENLQLKIVRTLLTAVTSKYSAVHEQSLNLALKTCFHIYLASREKVLHNTSKAVLTQMLQGLMKRMEGIDMDQLSSASPKVPPTPVPVPSADPPEPEGSLAKSDGDEGVGGGKDEGQVEQSATEITLAPAVSIETPAELEIAPPGISSDVPSTPGESVPESVAAAEGADGELGPVASAPQHPADWSDSAMLAQGFKNVAQKDVFIVFCRIVKMSMKVTRGSEANEDTIAMKSKLLSLELILKMLESAGPTFLNHEKIILAVKQHLCLALVQNGTSVSPTVSHLSLRIFVYLHHGFKAHLKNEIGFVFSNVVLRLLEGPQSLFQQRMSALQILKKLCSNPQTIVDIYANYDCSLDHTDIFEKFTNDLSKIVQRNNPAMNREQETQLKTLATETLVQVITSLVEWTHKCQEEQRHALEAAKEEPTDNGSVAEENGGEGGEGDGLQFAEQKKMKITSKRDLAEGVAKFNIKPEKGIDHMIKLGYIEDTPESIANFLRTTRNLNQTQIGDFIGSGDSAGSEYFKNIRNAFIDSLNFVNVSVDVAVRKFVERSNFKIPGEAQKIDRLMEKFAERFCRDNPEAFGNADCAYLLAYAIIMLNTDADSPNVKVKMQKSQFINTLRGIDNGKDLDHAMLSEIYDRVVSSPFRLHDLSVSMVSPSDAKHADEVLKEATATLRKQQQSQDNTYHTATDTELVRSMFQVSWCPMMASFSVLLEETDDPKLVSLCLEGMKFAVRIMSMFRMTTERDAFVSTLAKFTNLHSVKDMKPKNIEAIKACIDIAQTSGDNLQWSWEPVLRCISQIERLHLIATGSKDTQSESPISPPHKITMKSGSGVVSKTVGGNVAQAQEQEMSYNLLEQIDGGSIDWIFANSVNLNNEAIVDFVHHLVTIAREEIESETHPRVFSLQKIVEISYFNMSRIRIVWSRIWAVLGEHFIRVATHPNLPLAMFSIDSLKQLSMKFLEKDELANYTFQRDFLKPFDTAFAQAKSTEIRELVLACLTQLVLSRNSNIKSGWKNILHALSTAARDPSPQVVTAGFSLAFQISNKYLHLVGESYIDCVNALLAFGGNNKNIDAATTSISLIRKCTDRLAKGSLLAESHSGVTVESGPPSENPDGNPDGNPGQIPLPVASVEDKQRESSLSVEVADEEGLSAAANSVTANTPNSSTMTALAFSDSDMDFRVWFPTLTGLARLTILDSAVIRQAALEAMYGTLQDHGALFSKQLWDLIFSGVIFPMFDDLRHGEDGADWEWLSTTGANALDKFVELVLSQHAVVGFILPQLSSLLLSCLQSPQRQSFAIGLRGLETLCIQGGAVLSAGEWEILSQMFLAVISATSPALLISAVDFSTSGSVKGEKGEGEGEGEGEEEEGERVMSVEEAIAVVSARCDMRESLLNLLHKITQMNSDTLAASHVDEILKSFELVSTDAQRTYTNPNVLKILKEKGQESLAEKLRGEDSASTIKSLNILFEWTASATLPPESRAIFHERLTSRCSAFLTEYNKINSSPSADTESARHLSPLVLLILQRLADSDQDLFTQRLERFFPDLCTLIQTGDGEIRTNLASIFAHRLHPLLKKIVQ